MFPSFHPSFLPTAIKFHYQFNLRELSAVFQGLCASSAEYYTNPMQIVRLWRHETYRVYADRLVDVPDSELYEEMASRVTKNHFGDMDEEQLSSPFSLQPSAAVRYNRTFCMISVA